MTRTEKILAALRETPCEDDIQRLQKQVLVKLIESGFTTKLAGTETDEVFGLFAYMILKGAMLLEIGSSPIEGILILRMTGPDAMMDAYLVHQLECLGVFSDDEKELCLDNIEKALGI